MRAPDLDSCPAAPVVSSLGRRILGDGPALYPGFAESASLAWCCQQLPPDQGMQD